MYIVVLGEKASICITVLNKYENGEKLYLILIYLYLTTGQLIKDERLLVYKSFTLVDWIVTKGVLCEIKTKGSVECRVECSQL